MRASDAALSALEAVTIHEPSGWTWLGERFELARRADDAGPIDGARFRAALAAHVYAGMYITGGVAPLRDPPDAAPDRPAVQADLWDANTGRGSLRGGWTVRGRGGSCTIVERLGLRLRATADEVIGGDAPPGIGATVAVRMPKGSPGLARGFAFADGDAGPGVDTDEPLDRVYWNVRGGARPALMRRVTTVLNRLGLPFRFKLANDPEELRCDAAVLYTRRTLRPILDEALRTIFDGGDVELRPRVPLLTKPLAPGIGFAEDPAGEASFGAHRSELLADALIDAWRGGRPTRLELEAAYRRRFVAAGLQPDHPHLEPGSNPARDPGPLDS